MLAHFMTQSTLPEVNGAPAPIAPLISRIWMGGKGLASGPVELSQVDAAAALPAQAAKAASIAGVTRSTVYGFSITGASLNSGGGGSTWPPVAMTNGTFLWRSALATGHTFSPFKLTSRIARSNPPFSISSSAHSTVSQVP